MSENKSIQFIQNSLSEALGTCPRSTLTGYVDTYTLATPEIRRHLAVTTALELIKADTQSGETYYLQDHFDNLGVYADCIQQALDVKVEA